MRGNHQALKLGCAAIYGRKAAIPYPGGTISTPAGDFDTIRYEIRGGSPDNDVYVTRGENRRVVRIDVVGQDMQFLAVPRPASGG